MNLWDTYSKSVGNVFLENEGISLHFDPGIHKALKRLFLSFAHWLRTNYIFPRHMNVYIQNCETVTLLNGTTAYGSFRWFEFKNPYIRIPAKIQRKYLDLYTEQENYEMVLSSFVHEITHYYQWLTYENQKNSASECQANYYRYRIIEKYFKEIYDL